MLYEGIDTTGDADAEVELREMGALNETLVEPRGAAWERQTDDEVEVNDAEDTAGWNGPIARVAAIGFLCNFVPSEPFLTKYLVEDKGLSLEALNTRVWPADTFANLVFLVPVGVLAEVAGYRRTILVGLIARQGTRVLLIFGEGVATMMLMQVVYALQSACTTVFFAYALLVVPPGLRARSSAAVLGAFHLGNVLGSAVGQLLVDAGNARLVSLFYVSWVAQLAALALFFVALPPAVADRDEQSLGRLAREQGVRAALCEVAKLFAAMEAPGWLWAVWWVFGYSGWLVLGNWYQEVVLMLNPTAAFGLIEIGIEVCQTIGAGLAALLATSILAAARAPSLLVSVGVAQGTVVALCGGGAILDLMLHSASSSAEAATVLSARMLLFGLAQALAQPAIAQSLDRPYYALVFSINTLGALSVASLFTIVGASSGWDAGTWVLVVAVGGFAAAGFTLALGCVLWARKRGDVEAKDAGSSLARGRGASQGAFRELEGNDMEHI